MTQMASLILMEKWIVFYQNFPFGATHGLKCWVQLESDDLGPFHRNWSTSSTRYETG